MVGRRPLRETIRRYRNLIAHIRNWPVYIRRKIDEGVGPKKNEDLRLVTRGKRISLIVPRPCMGVFKEIFLQDVYDLNALFSDMPSNPVIVDVGANVGLFAVAAAEYADFPTLIAMEPMSANVAILKQNLAAIPGNVAVTHCHAVAASGRDREYVDLYYGSAAENTVIASTLPAFSDNNTSSERVTAMTLRRLMAEHRIDVIHLLKMDCEGAEFEILDGTPPEVFRRVERIVMEIHESATPGHSLGHVEAFLRAQGFRFRSGPLGEGLHQLWAKR